MNYGLKLIIERINYKEKRLVLVGYKYKYSSGMAGRKQKTANT